MKKYLNNIFIRSIVMPSIFSLFLLTISTFIQQKSIVKVFNFYLDHSKTTVLTFLIILSLIYILHAIFNSLYFSSITVLIITVFISIVNEVKKAFLDIVLTVWDVFQVHQALLIAPSAIGVFNIILIVFGILLLLIAFIWIGIKYKPHFKWKYKSVRVFVAIISILFLFSLGNYRQDPYNTYFNKIGISNQTWNINKAVNEQGIILNLVLNTALLKVNQPTNYSENKVRTLATEFAKKETKVSDIKPNIIVIMSESFFDVNKLGVFEEDADYLPNIRENQIGELTVSQIGGGTANVEFEVLTSMSMNAYERGITPYNQFIRREIPTLPSYLKTLGYETAGFHTHYSSFYNRGTNYPLLGFDDILFRNDITEPDLNGHSISDKQMTDLIINQIEGKDSPQFVFTLTMQNHLPYTYEREGEIATSVELSEANYNPLETYSLGIQESDKQFARLMKYIDESDQPTVVYFFGDHLPVIGNNYGIYLESKYISTGNSADWTEEELKKMHATPLASYSNFDIERDDFQQISSNYLATYILDELNLNNSTYPLYNYINDLKEEYPIYSTNFSIDKNGEFIRGKVINEFQDNYDLLQYDILLGKQYSLE